MSSTFKPKDITEALESVHRFLRLCFLSRVKSEGDGGYKLKNILIQSLVFCIIFIAADLYFLFQRIDQYTDLPIVYLVEIFFTISCLTDFTLLLYKANCDNEIKVRKEFDNLSIIDKILGVRSEIYERDRFTVNFIFYSFLVVRGILFSYCVIMFIYTNGITYSVPYIPHTWAQFLQGVNYAYSICKVKLYSFRVSEIIKQINRLGCINFERNDNEYNINGVEIKICYAKMYEICLIFNESQGLQILLAYGRLLVDAIGIIGFITNESSRHVVWSSTGPYILLFIDMVFLVFLVFYATSLLQTSKEMSFVVEKALVKNIFYNERERATWQEFVELVHRCPLVLTAYDFFPLDYSLLGTTFGTVVTYTIILTQLNH